MKGYGQSTDGMWYRSQLAEMFSCHCLAISDKHTNKENRNKPSHLNLPFVSWAFPLFFGVFIIFLGSICWGIFFSFLLVLSQLLTLWTEGTSLFAASDILASSAFAVFRSLKLQPWPLSHLPLSYSIFDKKLTVFNNPKPPGGISVFSLLPDCYLCVVWVVCFLSFISCVCKDASDCAYARE